jgi:cell division protein FtsA
MILLKHIYTSVDIGSDTIKIVVCEMINDKLHLLAKYPIKSKGIKKGLIANFDEVASLMKLGFAKIEDMLGFKIKKVLVNVPSYFTEFIMIKGSLNILHEDKKITGKDVVKVIESAVVNQELKDREIVATIPVDFCLDNDKIVKDPKGMEADVLAVRGVMITSPKKSVYSVLNLFDSIDVEVVDISLGAIGDLYINEDEKTREKLGAIVNIGAETTNVAIFNKMTMLNNSCLQIGSKAIDNDLAYIFKTSFEDAVNLKEKFGIAYAPKASSNDFNEINTLTGKSRRINQLEVSEIISARLDDILGNVQKELAKLTSKELSYIIFTGGITNLIYFDYLIKTKFGSNARLCDIEVIGARDSKYSSCLGNILYFENKLKLKGENYYMVKKEDIASLTNEKENEKKESMLNTIFSYFFGE